MIFIVISIAFAKRTIELTGKERLINDFKTKMINNVHSFFDAVLIVVIDLQG